MPSERRGVLAIAGIAATLAFLTVIQVRSQAEVARSLETQDNTSLAFLIDDLHNANDELAAQAASLAAQADTLSRPRGSELAALNAEATSLRIVEGTLAVKGPGIRLLVDAPLTSLDLQDAANGLRGAGAEAIAIDDRRVIASTPITQGQNEIEIDGVAVTGPWTISAIGNPATLQPQAEAMESSLRADPRVRSVDYAALADLAITAVVMQRPFVYASS